MDYEELYDKIYRYCYYRLQQKEIAEDITQETFLRFFGKEKYYSGENPLKIMYTIAKNLCIDESRKKKALFLEHVEEIAEGQGRGNMEDELLTSCMLKSAMEKLSHEEREILFLRVVNEEPLSVIGEMFQISRYAVYRKCQHAIKVLRKELEK